ncbi:MAG: LamG-like jellyroll fold domain-containing protein, partial [Stackebrandtia sp.]
RLGDIDGQTVPNLWSTALSQAGVRNSGFYLQYAQKPADGLNYWALAVRQTDTDGAVTPRVYSRETADLATWTHLAASYDPIDASITLWVNGAAQGSVPLSQPQAWHAAGPVQVGRAKANGVYGLYWGGDVDDVHLYQGVLS